MLNDIEATIGSYEEKNGRKPRFVLVEYNLWRDTMLQLFDIEYKEDFDFEESSLESVSGVTVLVGVNLSMPISLI